MIFARADSILAAAAEIRTATGSTVVSAIGDQAAFKLFDDQFQVLGLGFEVPGVVPLEHRFETPADFPVGITQMIVEDRILGTLLDRAFQLDHRLLVAPEPVVGPTEAVDDEAVIGALFGGRTDHVESFVEIAPHVDP